jgi:hypothetical protein
MALNDGTFSTSIFSGSISRPNVGVLEDDLVVPTDRPSEPLSERNVVFPKEHFAANAFDRTITLTRDLFNSGVLSVDYGGEFVFERVWVQPLLFALGFIVEDSTHEIKIWNAYRTKAVQTTAVSVVDQEGTDLEYPPLPDTIQVFGDTIYTLTVYQDGPPLQDTTWKLTIDGEDFEIQVTGVRVIPWFLDLNWDQSPIITYDFETVIFTTNHLKEQRRPLSDESWMELSAKFDTSAGNNRKIFNLLAYGQDKVFGLPIYTEKLSCSSIGTISLDVNEDMTYLWNLQNNASFVIIVDHDNALAEIKEIGSIAGQTINFNQNISASFDASKTYVYPAMFAIIGAYSADNLTNDFDSIKADFREFKSG